MNRIEWYWILACIWILLRSRFTLMELLIGISLSLMILALTEKMNPDTTWRSQWKELMATIFVFLLSVLRANITLAWDILWHRRQFSHAFFKIDCSRLTPWQTVLVGNMISLTPGSLTVDADSEGTTLYVHTLYGDQIDAIKGQILRLVQRMSRFRRRSFKDSGMEDLS